MRREHEELIDFVLHELTPKRHREVAERIARDPEVAAERDRLLGVLGLVRAAAADGWPAPTPRAARIRVLRPVALVAAVLLVALGLFLVNGAGPQTFFEPDGPFGYLLPEEADAHGRVPVAATGTECVLRQGTVMISAVGSDREYALAAGESFPYGSEIKTPAETGARVDLSGKAILFLAPISTVQLRKHNVGGPALRLMDGVVCTVAEETPIHIAVDDTDLLLRQESGAALMRQAPGEAVALRGELRLLISGGGYFRVPPGERLPAACATAPRTAGIKLGELDLAWYRDLVYTTSRFEEIKWSRPGCSEPFEACADTMIYLRAVPEENGTLEISYGEGEPREFPLFAGKPLQVRLRVRDLGPGPELRVSPSKAITQARIFEAR